MDIDLYQKNDLSTEVSFSFRIKYEINNNKKLWKSLSLCNTVLELKETLMCHLSEEYDLNDKEKECEKISQEIIELRKNPGNYLIGKDGKAILRITPDMLYHASPVTTEDGRIRPGPIQIHPKISSGITLAVHEKTKLANIEKSYPNSPALKHIKEPSSILDVAISFLLNQECEISEEEGDEKILEVGREAINGVFQSFNPSFIRSELFGRSLALKMIKDGVKKFRFTKCERKYNSRFSWYEVSVIVSG